MIRVFDDADSLRLGLADYVKAACSSSSRDRFVIAISGGSMPKLLSKIDEDFSKWDVFFADERCVPLSSAESNFKACQDLFPGAKFHTVDTALSPADAAKGYEARFVECGGAFDLVLLGSGPDGHTASLFPGRTLDETRLVDSILDSPKPPPARVTFTFRALRSSRRVAFVATGSSKAELFSEIFVRDGEKFRMAEDPPHLPITAFKEADWFIDAPAASRIKSH